LRRHFFLVAAIAVLALMFVVAGLKLTVFKGEARSGGALAQGAAGASPKGGRGGGGGPTQVSVLPIQARSFVDAIEVIGVAKGRQSVTLSAATTQLVDRVRFRDGQTVRRGEVLVELRNMEQNAGIEQAQARLVQAERAFQRYKALGDKGFAPKAAIDEYEAAYLSAKADVAAAQARQNDRTIRAPFAGVVGLSDVAPGALVNPGAPIVTLDDISAIRVDFPVPERFLGQLRQGQSITAAVDAYPGQLIPGRIAQIDTRVDERTRAVIARAEFPNPGHRLKPGMMVRVSIARGQRQALSAPESAVAVQGDSAFVYVVNARGEQTTTEQRPVLTGARQDGFVELRDGVQAGDRVVADGLNKVLPGQPVRVVGGSSVRAAPPAAREPT
jgi:membrane fusion protein (multidrug efflux system)